MIDNFKDAFILEPNDSIVRLCANCDKEQNLDQKKIISAGWQLSHGICKRHTAQMYKFAGFSDDRIAAALKKSETGSDKPPIRDLLDPINKPFLDWLRNPTPSPTFNKS